MGFAPHQLKALGLDYEVPPQLTRNWQDGEVYAVGDLFQNFALRPDTRRVTSFSLKNQSVKFSPAIVFLPVQSAEPICRAAISSN
jgi:hypothetical protein